MYTPIIDIRKHGQIERITLSSQASIKAAVAIRSQYLIDNRVRIFKDYNLGKETEVA